VGRRPGALARYLLDHAEVDACEFDPFAFAAIRINAAANGVGVATVESQPRWPGERWTWRNA
jgi:predicted nicotinamide N-methyase